MTRLVVALARHLGDRVTHVVRRQELALLDVDHRADARGGDEQIRLPREERRICSTSAICAAGAACDSFVDVRQDRQPGACLHISKRLQTRLEAWAAERRPRCAVGFVERRFEDDRHTAARGDLAQRGRQLQRVRRALDPRTAQPGTRAGGRRLSSSAYLCGARPIVEARRAVSYRVAARVPTVASSPVLCRCAASASSQRAGRPQRTRLELGVKLHDETRGCDGSSAISTNLPSGERPDTRIPFSVSDGSHYGQLNSNRWRWRS